MNASRDGNFMPTMLVTLNTDGKTLIPLRVTPTHKLFHSDGTTGTDKGPKNAPRDDNNVPALMGVSSNDFSTPVVIYGDINGNILTQSS